MAQKLALQWSPEQISGKLNREFPTDEGIRIPHEEIYRSLFTQIRGVLKNELTSQLRTARQMRHAKGGKAKRIALCRAIGKETFLLGNDTHIATLVERHSRFTISSRFPKETQ